MERILSDYNKILDARDKVGKRLECTHGKDGDAYETLEENLKNLKEKIDHLDDFLANHIVEIHGVLGVYGYSMLRTIFRVISNDVYNLLSERKIKISNPQIQKIIINVAKDIGSVQGAIQNRLGFQLNIDEEREFFKLEQKYEAYLKELTNQN